MNKALAQRSVLRMLLGRFEERPELLDGFEFLPSILHQFAPPESFAEETDDMRRLRTLRGLRELVSD